MSLTVTNSDIFMMQNPNSPVVLGVHSSYFFLGCGLCPVDFLEGAWLLGLSFLVESDPVVPGFFPTGALVCFLSCSDETHFKKNLSRVLFKGSNVAPNNNGGKHKIYCVWYLAERPNLIRSVHDQQKIYS